MVQMISASTLRSWLYHDAELALLDVREVGQTVLGHILFSAPLPYSVFETRLGGLVPNPRTRVVLCDAGDGVSERAARRAAAMGYTNVSCLDGGVAAWAAAGHTLYEGVNVPSKAFGELVEHAADTPRLTAEEVATRSADRTDMVIVDGRPLEEFAKMNIPGGNCCPNGELALRIGALAPDPATTVIINCAGRTRSIIGAQTLIDLGIPNPVYALENGTQGWVLAGLDLERGTQGDVPGKPSEIDGHRVRAKAVADRFDVAAVSSDQVRGWLNDPDRTTYLLDVRTLDERQEDPVDRRAMIDALHIAHAPGGQLVQATDQWIGTRRAHVVVLDTEDVRAPVTAAWLRRLGHDACTVDGGIDALASIDAARTPPMPELSDPEEITATQLAPQLSKVQIIDLRSSGSYRAGHIPGAVWSTRARLGAALCDRPVVLVADDPAIAALATVDLREAGHADVQILGGGMSAWTAAAYTTDATPDQPTDADRIDFLSFTHGRHAGNLDASRQYLAWEIALVDQLDADERAVFRV
ncbi:MAG: rhodanese-like domain-containing protein [Pseudomonadota bacterium]